MRQLAALVIVPMLVSLLVSGCFSSVTRDGGSSTTKVDGIPFFPKKGVCKLESVWIEPLITLTYSKTITLKYASDAKPGEKREPLKPIVHLLSRAFSRSQIHRHQPQLTQFRGILSQAKIFSHEEVERIDTLWNEIGMDDRGNYERDYIPLQQPEAVLVPQGQTQFSFPIPPPPSPLSITRRRTTTTSAGRGLAARSST